jgi:hypothetical protein
MVLIRTLQVTSRRCKVVDCNMSSYILQWLVNFKPAAENAVAVEDVVMGVDSSGEMSQDNYLTRMVKLGPARTSNRKYLPPDLGTKEKMIICSAHPRRSWPYGGTNYGDDACHEWQSE